LGLVPEAGSSLLLPQLVGYQRAAELLLLGEEFDAVFAERIGLVNRVLPTEAVDGFALAQAAKLVALPAGALRATKKLLKGGLQSGLDAQMAQEGAEFRERLNSPEAREAFTAFFERRKADFTRFS
jgi:enoyl-CoA hydratase/carnithine racemase